MISLVLALWLASISPPGASLRLQKTAPQYLTPETARDHLTAARLAAYVYGLDYSLLLAIAWHESRYTPTKLSPESGGRVSCGVMSPEPKDHCSPGELTVLGGYMAGAAHLALRLRLCDKNLRCALIAYAGGRGLMLACNRLGHWWVRPRVDACDIAREFRAIAAGIRHAIGTA